MYQKIFSEFKKNPSPEVLDDLISLARGEKNIHWMRVAVDAAEWGMRYTTDYLRYYSLMNTALFFAASKDFDCYLRFVEWNRDDDKRFYEPRREVLKPVVNAMQNLADDKMDLLTISMPPGTGKSTLGIFFLSWMMGRFPNKPNLASAHSGVLTRSFYEGVLQIITDPEYLWKQVFPVELAGTNSKDETIDLDKYHRFSTLTCRAINASLTGATRCEGILYVDDLCSGIEEAMSRERMDKLWTMYTNDLKSRKKQGAKEIHIATRWSVHDPIGRLEQMYGNDPRCQFITMPALNADGESNFNYSYGVGFDTNYFMDMKANLDDASFRALFMNEPIEREGQLYSPDEVQWYFDLPDGEPDKIIACCDTKDRGEDYCVMPVVYQYGQNYFVEDCICDNGKPETIDIRLIAMLLKHKVHMARFESNAAGGRVAKTVQDGVKEKGGRTKITTKFTTANKETKIVVNSPWIKEHFYFKDSSVAGKEYNDMMRQLFGYTMMGKNKHDDVPDAMSQLAEFCQSFDSQKAVIFDRPF